MKQTLNFAYNPLYYMEIETNYGNYNEHEELGTEFASNTERK